jgi:hypothetical protein
MALRFEFDPANKILLLHFEGQLLEGAKSPHFEPRSENT